jgi:hypothetical protein
LPCTYTPAKLIRTPNWTLLYAAEKAAAKREAARSRKKLSEFTSKLLGELDSGEACVVRPGGDQESQEQGNREDPQSQGKRTEKQERGDARDADSSVSDCA